MDVFFHTMVLALTLAGSVFFSTAETALFSLSKIEKRRLQDKYPQIASWVLQHLERPRRTLITILIGNLIVNTLAASLATLLILNICGPSAVGGGMMLFTVGLILFCEIMPKVIAVRYTALLAFAVSLPLQFFSVAIYPFRLLKRFLTEKILSLITHEKKEQTDLIAEDELRALVKIGEEEGILDKDETRMIGKIFELGDRPAKEIMTPRTDLVGVDIEDSADKHLAIMKGHHFSQILAYQGSLDHILGVLSVQEFMLSEDRDVRKHLSQPLFISQTKRIDELLEAFRRNRLTFALCVDEYGGTAGIVTLEDVLEEIFGEYYDEYAKVDHPIRRISQTEFIVEAKLALSDFNKFFETHLIAEDAATIGGYVLERSGEVPFPGQTLELEGLDIRVHPLLRQRIRHLIVRKRT